MKCKYLFFYTTILQKNNYTSIIYIYIYIYIYAKQIIHGKHNKTRHHQANVFINVMINNIIYLTN